ncbi:MAG TPA: hypothetical protein PK133_10230 [Ferruginibacter sp.]|nr:hypothetical protein [Ferruginibacter sp.]HQY12581.1 hypothetical protein [Ferruginibacter sp.]
MKKLFLLLVACTLFVETIAQGVGEMRTSRIKFRGIISSDSENVKKETDPSFAGRLNQKRFQFGDRQSANTMQLTGLANGMDVMKEATGRLTGTEYRFTLLPGHKYMVNNCLGLKVSAGEFKIKFKNPHVETAASGTVKIRLEVELIRFNAIKIRIKPRSPDLSDPNPCHFSGKFEIGGEAKNLTMTAYLNPVVASYQAVGGSTTFCFIGFEDAPKVDWVINALNFADFINSLDHAAKEMVLDGLDLGMQNLLLDAFIDMVRSVMKKYYETCEIASAYGKYYAQSILATGVENNTEYEVAGNEIRNKIPEKKQSAEKWVITPVTAMKGVLGRLNTDFPAEVEWTMDVRTTEDKFITNRSGSGRHGSYYDIAPGNYYFRLNTITVPDVPIEKGKETRLKAGYLSVVSEGNWSLYSESKEKFHTSGNKPKKIALPVGNYQLKLGGQYFPLVINDGKTVEM